MQEPLYGTDKIFNGIMLFILCVELVLAWRCMGRFITDKTARFAVEYGEEHGGQQAEAESVVAERQALERFIRGADEVDAQRLAEEEEGAFDDTIGTLRSGRSARAGGGEVELGATRTSVLGTTMSGPPSVRASFGGPSVVPYSAAAARSMPRGSSAPRGSAAPSLAGTANLGASFPARTPSLGQTGASLMSSRGLETEEERRARRARDRAIIEGRIVPQRRRDAEDAHEAELQAARDAIAAQQQATLDQLAANRPTIATLSSPPANRVRIPIRPELHSPAAASPDAGLKRD
jgi:hypothetical protein